jgi:cytochrome P450
MVILNNYELNTSPKLWTSPEKFLPERFLTDSGAFRKPAHFLPFSSGKRACMGYKLVEKVTKRLLDTIIADFDLVSTEDRNVLPISCLAVHPVLEIKIQLIPRKIA